MSSGLAVIIHHLLSPNPDRVPEISPTSSTMEVEESFVTEAELLNPWEFPGPEKPLLFY